MRERRVIFGSLEISMPDVRSEDVGRTKKEK